ncbi:MAG: phosphotriesterase [Actinomycetota bacterium]|nr:phosphotriesterase [Actinomycetota bacterium]
MATVETVTGPVDASELGETLIHEHLLARDEAVLVQFPQMGTVREDPVKGVTSEEAEDVAAEMMSAAAERGVRTVVEPSCMYLGRDVRLMKRVSEETGVQVVPCTGIYTYEHLPTPLVTRDADQIADLFVHDIEVGIQGTDIKAAFLKCAADEPGVTENVEKVHRAVARASLRTGVPIMAHSRPASDTAPRQIEIFSEEGVDLAKVQIAHCGDSPDADYIESLIEKGVWAGLDRYGIEMYLPFDQRIATHLALLERGYADRIFVSADSCATIDWFAPEAVEQMTGAGMVSDWTIKIVHDKVLPALREGGMTEAQERTMLHENPVSWLTST